MIQRLKSAQDIEANTDSELLDLPELASVVEITRKLFGGEVSVTSECDPSFPDDEFYCVAVTAKGSAEEVLSLHVEWHQQVAAALGNDHELRLAIERA